MNIPNIYLNICLEIKWFYMYNICIIIHIFQFVSDLRDLRCCHTVMPVNQLASRVLRRTVRRAPIMRIVRSNRRVPTIKRAYSVSDNGRCILPSPFTI